MKFHKMQFEMITKPFKVALKFYIMSVTLFRK